MNINIKSCNCHLVQKKAAKFCWFALKGKSLDDVWYVWLPDELDGAPDLSRNYLITPKTAFQKDLKHLG